MRGDETLVYPAHGAGSLCGKNLSGGTVSTIGAQRLYNYALRPMSRDGFIELVAADQPDPPAYFTYDAVLNARERLTLDQALERELPSRSPSARGTVPAGDPRHVREVHRRLAALLIGFAAGEVASSVGVE